ncbi:MAG: winged helix-turn-helix transcriptional regulator [Solirubrobacteraceae bacterium]
MTRSYAQLCGIAAALDVIGDRWALLIVRDLLLGPLRFSDLATGLPGVGTNTLTDRLKQLEAAGVIQRRLLALPDGSVVYELTPYGRELEPILMGLGRWGTRSMGSLAPDVATRSRWLVAAMLAFHDERQAVSEPTTWELRLSDGPFTVRAEGTSLTVAAGAPQSAEAVVTASDQTLYLLLTGQLAPARALEAGSVTVLGRQSMLPRLLALFAFPAITPPSAAVPAA